MTYPLRFQPQFRQYLWGGRRLGSVLGKPIDPSGIFAESWEVVDHGEDQSVVLAGEWAGKSLAELRQHFPEELFGKHAPQRRFPLLFKYLDAQKDLSVQVHPNDAQAATQQPPDLGKTESWLIVAAEPGSKLYAGLKADVTATELRLASADGTVADLLHVVQPKVGDCVFIPAGTVHAIGAGLLVAEIQQASDTTFRLFDWNRVGNDGKPRELHVSQAIDVTDFRRGPVSVVAPQPTTNPYVEQLVACDKFVFDRWSFPIKAAGDPNENGSTRMTLGGDNRFHMLRTVRGSVTLVDDPTDQPLDIGKTVLLPAGLGSTEIKAKPGTILLDMYLP